MDRTGRVVGQVRRRLLAGEVLAAGGTALSWGAGAAVGLLGVSKLVGEPVAWWWVLGGALALAAIVGVLIGLGRRRSSLGAAAVIDLRLGLKDRVSTAVALDGTKAEDPFARLSVEDAERLSAEVRVARAAPIRMGNAWVAWPVLAGIAAGVGAWVPSIDLAHARGLSAERAARRDEMARRLDVASRAAAAPAPTPKPGEPTPDAPADKHQQLLDDLKRELTAGKVEPEQAAERAAREIDRAAAEQEKLSSSERAAHDAAREALARAAEKSGEPNSALSRALRDGDLASAADAARDLLNPSEADGSAEGREKAARELERIAAELREAERAKDAARREADVAPRKDQAGASAAAEVSQKRTEDGAARDSKNVEEPGVPRSSVQERIARALERAAEEMTRQQREQREGATRAEPQPKPGAPGSRNESETTGEPKSDSGGRPERSVREQPANGAGPQQDTSGRNAEGAKDAPPPQPSTKSASERIQDKQAKSESGEGGEVPAKSQPEATAKDGRRSGEAPAGGADTAHGRPSERPSGSSTSGNQNARDQAQKRESGGREAEADPAKGGDSKADRTPGERGDETGQPKPSDQPHARGARDANPAGEQLGESGTKQKSAAPSKQQGAIPERSASPGSQQQSNEQPGPSDGHAPPQPSAPDVKPGEPATHPNEQRRGKPESESHSTPQSSVDSADPSQGGAAEKPEAPAPTHTPQSGSIEGSGAKPSSPAESKRTQANQPGAQQTPNAHNAEKKPADQPDAKPGDPHAQQNSKGPVQPQPHADPPASTEGLKQLVEELKQLANAPKDAASREQQARDMRKAADEMLRNTTPEQRREAEKWARAHPAALDAARKELEQAGAMPKRSGGDPDGRRQPGSGPGGTPEGSGGARAARESAPARPERTETVDARRAPGEKPPRERVIAEWYADKQPGEADRAAGTLAPGAEETVRQAAQSGERAVDDQAVPSRFDTLLLKYFKRLPERAKAEHPATGQGGSSPPAPAAAPAKDAP